MKATRFILILIVVCSLGAIVACKGGDSKFSDAGVAGQDNSANREKRGFAREYASVRPLSDAEWRDGDYLNFDSAFTIASGSDMVRIFNDSNKYQYAAAERIGLDPIVGIGDAYFTRRPLVKIATCTNYQLDSLTHSMPYLVPEAAQLLDTIGARFRARVKKMGGGDCRIRVTSVLRSGFSVKKLRRINRNATDSSTHKLGTTFDISYARFDQLSGPPLPDGTLKVALANVLLELRKEKKCMVKYERKSPCFHISATGR